MIRADGIQELDLVLEEFQRRWRVRLRRTIRDALGDSAGLRAFPLLGQVVCHGPLSPTELAQRLELRTSTIAAHVDRLEELGWATRGGKGRKGVLVRATPEGEAAHRRYLGLRRQLLGEFTLPLRDEEVQALRRLLDALVRGQSAEDSQ